MKGQANVFKGVFILIISIILVAIIGFSAFKISKHTGNVDTFYVEIDGKKITSIESGYQINKYKPLKVAIKTPLSKELPNYYIDVVPNQIKGKDFNYLIDDRFTMTYSNEENLIDGFIVNKKDSSFTIKPFGNATDVIQKIYPVNTIEDISKYEYDDMFSLVIYSCDEDIEIRVNFTII